MSYVQEASPYYRTASIREINNPYVAKIEKTVPREILGSVAFNLEYREEGRDTNSLRDDIISYLGEYRFEVDKFNYELNYKKSSTGDVTVLAPDGESMIDKSVRAVQERKLRGDPTHREENETSGLLSLQEQLKVAKDGDTLFWASPPGPASEGYGDYGFIYHGKVEDGMVQMAAMRVDNPTIEQYNRAMSILTKEEYRNTNADSFLSRPKIVDGEISEKDVEKVLKDCFAFKASDEKQRRFAEIIEILSPLIEKTIYAIQKGEKAEKLKTFYALENYAIKLRDGDFYIEEAEEKREYKFISSRPRDYDSNEIIAAMSYKPPIARGSCGATGSGSPVSSSLFSSMSAVAGPGGLLDAREPFKCPKCSYTTTSPVGNRCPGCGLTKEAYAAELAENGGGEVCD